MNRSSSVSWNGVTIACLAACGALVGCGSDSGSGSSGVMPGASGSPGTMPGVAPGATDPLTGEPVPVATDPSGNPIDPGTPMTDASGNPVGTGTTATPDPSATDDATGDPPELDCSQPNPGRAPLRRLTRFEYNNTLADLLGNDGNLGNSLPPEQSGNGFGNDADQQPVSDFLVEQYGVIAEDAGLEALANADFVADYAACLGSVTAETEAGCARSFVEAFLPSAYRRAVDPAEADELVALQEEVRAMDTFESSLAAVIEAVLQTPDFLYRLEFGEPNPTNSTVLRPTGAEMATRLSYLLWGTMPDPTLEAAASSGELSTAEGVLTNATRMLDDQRSRPVIRFFFDNYLPLNTLTDVVRDAEQYPTFSPTIGALMREETQTFLEREIFSGAGDWPSMLTAPHTYVNEELANYYGIAGITGEEFQQAPLDTTQRLGLLTQGAVMTGTTITNFTNPVKRGVFILDHVMCQGLPPPPENIADLVMPPDPYSGDTGRERYSIHSEDATCASCHAVMDPPGFALENYDAVGLWRDTENGVTIDATGELGILGGAFDGPVEMAQRIAENPDTHACLAENWLTFAYGRTLDTADECTVASVETAFTGSGYNVKQLLLALTQTDAFLYMPATQE